MILFKNREEAGLKLAKKLEKYKNGKVIILAIPRGGVAVGSNLAKELKAELDLIIPRKLPIPENPEMGFGAIISDGTILLNEPIIRDFGITKKEIEEISKEVLKEVGRREKIYRGKKTFPKVKDKIVVLADDGLATGFTMLAAIKAIKKHQPKKVIVAIPVTPRSAYKEVKTEVDELVTLYIEDAWSFAVANYYQDFHDLSDEEVIEKLKMTNF